MNAIQFIQQHGVDRAKECLPAYEKHYCGLEQLFVEDLKRLVKSVDLIKKHGGLFSTKCQLDKGGSHYEWYGENGDYGLTDLEDLEQAIADYESIYSEQVK